MPKLEISHEWETKTRLGVMVVAGGAIVYSTKLNRFKHDLAVFIDSTRENARELGFDGIQDDQLEEIRGEIEKLLVDGPPDKRSTSKTDKDSDTSSLFELLEPAESEVDPARLLDDILGTLTRFVTWPRHAAEAVALWVVHAYCFSAFDVTPRLLLTSPVRRCGKTRVLTLIRYLVNKSILVDNVSLAAFFRLAERDQPCFLIDEADTFLNNKDNTQIVGALNSGYQRNGQVIRCEGDDHEPRAFHVFCPAAIAMIGLPKDTLVDRSVAVPLARRKASEEIESFRIRDLDALLRPLRQQALRFSNDRLEDLASANPAKPEGLDDRAFDMWEPLLVIAELAGESWLDRATCAALGLSGDRDADDDSTSIELLRDIKELFEQPNHSGRIRSAALVTHLKGLEERDYVEWNHGHGINQKNIARLVNRFGIQPRTVRFSGDTKKGYMQEWFQDAFERFLGAPTESVDEEIHPGSVEEF